MVNVVLSSGGGVRMSKFLGTGLVGKTSNVFLGEEFSFTIDVRADGSL